ncbi:MAG: tRNA (adenine-N1)-methyltransferase [Nitriliruptoraceae bacterium]
MSGPILPGTDEPLAPGEWVVLHDRRRRRYLITLEPGAQWHSHAGLLEHDAMIGSTEGTALRTNRNMEVLILRPTREDYVLKMKRGAQVVYPKDQAMIVGGADVRPGCVVVEAGAGSGALTLALLDAVGPTGRVVSFERREDHARIAQRNVEAFHGHVPHNWELRLGDVEEGLPELRAHRVVLDLLESWRVVDASATALAPGGILVSYTPTVPQVMRLTEALDADGRFLDVRTSETMQRNWDVDGLAVRPAHRMVAHTAFLTVARRVVHPDEGGPTPRYRKPADASVRWVDGPVDGAPDDPVAGAASGSSVT